MQLADVASVSDGFGEQRSIGKVRGKQVVTFSLSRAKGASDVSVYDEAMKILDQIEEANPGVEFTRLFTSVDYTKDQYSSSMLAMIEGAVLAVWSCSCSFATSGRRSYRPWQSHCQRSPAFGSWT